MKKSAIIFLLIGALLIVTSACRSKTNDDAAVPTTDKSTILIEVTTEAIQTSIAEEDIFHGVTMNHQYINSYFDINIKAPISWVILSDEAMTLLMDNGLKVLDNEMPTPAGGLAEGEVGHLFGFVKYPLTEEVLMNPSLILTAEKVDESKGPITGMSYLEVTKGSLLDTELPFDVGEVLNKSTADHKDYGELYAAIQVGDLWVQQRHIAYIEAGYIITCVMTYDKEDEESQLIFADLTKAILQE